MVPTSIETATDGLLGRIYTAQSFSYQQYDENLKVGAQSNHGATPLLADADDVAAQDEHRST